MSGVATAIVGSAVIGAYASNQSSNAMSEGVQDGLEAEERMFNLNMEFQQEMLDQQRADMEPWSVSGQRALDSIWSGIESGAFQVGNINLEDDPGYQVRMQSGVDALDSSASANGLLNSGAQSKALVQYGQDQGSQEYAAAYARELNEKQNNFNILSGLAVNGQNADSNNAAATSQLASTTSNAMSNLGTSQNVANQNLGTVRASSYGDQATIANQAAQNWLTYKGTTPTTTGTGG